MLQDISVAVGDHLFNYRVAAIIRCRDKVLVNQLVEQDFWFLPGGRVQEGESTMAAVEREIREELSAACTVKRPVFLHENFFLHQGRRFHEVCVYYDVELPLEGAVSLGGFSTVDGGIHLKWVEVKQLASINLRPPFLASHLQTLPPTLEHIVSHR